MGTASLILTNFEVDRWNADIYGAMALASRLSSLVKNRAATVKLAYDLRKLDRAMASFFHEIHKGIKRGQSKRSDATPEQVLDASDTLLKMHSTITRLYEACKRSRLTNHSLMAGTLRNINEYNEEVLELSSLLRLSIQPEVVEAIYNRAREEQERGEVFDLSEV